ncbi:MAG TPA: DUF4870 domain-containing protein [Candidatus Acidoferrales bacterium]|nr:DUF4870 domain-containing protein [Candidatus Acidoferrales bacterium]
MSDANIPVVTFTELTQDEKAYAGLAHALMMSTWWIGPLIIYLTKKESRFVSFHAMQALLWQIIFTVLYFVGIAAWIVVIFSTVAMHPQNTPNQPFPIAVFIVMPIFWLFMMGAIAISLTLGIMYCLKAMRGEWAAYPVIGRWARKIVGD